MKKVILLSAFGFLALVSCQKDYSCKCTDVAGGGSERNIDFQSNSKSDAEDICAAEEGVFFGITFTCALE